MDDILDLNATENQCTSAQNIHLSSAGYLRSTLPITWILSTHQIFASHAILLYIHTYMKPLNEGKVYKYSSSVVGDHTWKTGACSTCEHVKSLQLGGRPKKKAGSGRPSIQDINTVISHLECIAPYPLVPYTSIMPTALDKQLSK